MHGWEPESLGCSNPEAAKKTEAESYFLLERSLDSYTPAPVRAGPEKAEGPFRIGLSQLISQSILKWFATSVSAY